MIEIIVLIYVLNWFYKTAKRLEKNATNWVLIALFSFLIPILVISFIVYPSLMFGWINKENEIFHKLVLILINLVFGISGIFIAKSFLLHGHLPEFKKKKKTFFIFIISFVIILISLIFYSYDYKINHSEDFVELKNISGVNKLEGGMYRESISDFNDFLKNNPTEHSAYYNRATAYFMLKSYDSSMIDFKKVVELNTYSDQIEHFRTFRYIGQCFLLTNQIDSAILYFKYAHEISPEDKIVSIKLLELYMNQNNTDEFLKLIKSIDFNSIQEDLPNSVRIYSDSLKN